MRAKFTPLLGLLGLSAFSFALFGCGATYYSVQVTSASARVEEARTVRAAELAPYEYYYAREHLFQAQVEAAAANYSDAARYAEVADDFAVLAIAASTHPDDKTEAGERPSGADSDKGDKRDKRGKRDDSDTSTDSTEHETDPSP